MHVILGCIMRAVIASTFFSDKINKLRHVLSKVKY